jgi:hypothetical protein
VLWDIAEWNCKCVSKNRLRTIEEMTVVEEYDNPTNAGEGYKLHHKEKQEWEFYVFHTSKQEIEVIEEYFTGIRRS